MSTPRRTTAFVAALLLAISGFVAASPSDAGPRKPEGQSQHDHGHNKCQSHKTNLHKLLRCVTLKGVMEHQRAFAKIARRHDDSRASGTSGYNASVRYVKKRLKRAGYRVRVQPFVFYNFEEAGASVLQRTAPNPDETYVEGTDFAATTQSEFGDVTADVTAVDVDLGPGNTSTSGCEAADFDTFPANDIALIQRGTCTFEVKAENAAAAGAVGVVFFNQGETDDEERQGIPAVTLGNGYTGGIPAVSTTYDIGAELYGISGLRLRLFANVTRERETTSNVIATSKRGKASNIVMAGAHLDSVPEGPGINDNGSGSAALLEVAEQLGKAKTRNKVRFAWWGAEEAGLVGSTYYVDDLVANNPAGLAAIKMYLNFDMVASPNYGLFRYDGDGSDFGLVGPDGSDEIEATFARFYAKRDIPSESSEFSGRSDYQAFINNGIPSGGLFTGAEGIKTAAQAAKWGGTAGVAYDPCYHAACDTIKNLSRKALRINSDAIAYAVYVYASGREVLNDRRARASARSAGPFA